MFSINVPNSAVFLFQFTKHYSGYFACLLVGLLFVVFMPLFGLILCCCRCCCGNCGAHPGEPGKSDKCKRISCGILLAIFATIMLWVSTKWQFTLSAWGPTLHCRLYIVASELKDPIWHSLEWQIGSFSSEATRWFWHLSRSPHWKYKIFLMAVDLWQRYSNEAERVTKTFMKISNWKNTFDLHSLGLYKNISVLLLFISLHLELWIAPQGE